MKIFDVEEIMKLDKYFRINLINTASGVKSANLIGTKNAKSINNLAIFNSVIHIGANPPCLGFIMRPLTVERHTYDNIKANKYFTINQVNSAIVKQAHQTSAKYKSDESEFEKCQLTEEYINDFPSPFVKESKIKIGLSYVEEHHIKLNDTVMMIGKIEQLILPETAIATDGSVQHADINTIAVSGLSSYYEVNFKAQFEFARPEKNV